MLAEIMDYLQTGQFRGETYQTIAFDGVTATETEYDYSFIDWHYHENPYFSLNVLGTCIENNKRESFVCAPLSLLFHNCQEPHYNTKTDPLTRGFQVEIARDWCKKYEIDLDSLPKSKIVRHPDIKLSFYNIYKESKLSEDTSGLTVDALLLQIFETMCEVESKLFSIKPGWVKKIDEILRENLDQPLTLQGLSNELDIHWAHLSRDFPRYFQCNFSEYIRKIRLEKTLNLLRNIEFSLTDIALMAGFADQSHFIRTFKNFYGITPKKFRQIISR